MILKWTVPLTHKQESNINGLIKIWAHYSKNVIYYLLLIQLWLLLIQLHPSSSKFRLHTCTSVSVKGITWKHSEGLFQAFFIFAAFLRKCLHSCCGERKWDLELNVLYQRTFPKSRMNNHTFCASSLSDGNFFKGILGGKAQKSVFFK